LLPVYSNQPNLPHILPIYSNQLQVPVYSNHPQVPFFLINQQQQHQTIERRSFSRYNPYNTNESFRLNQRHQRSKWFQSNQSNGKSIRKF
jgi:hypothetical protein